MWNRGRGRGAAKDAFHQYEPWRNPTQYCGMIRFESGGRHFQLERDFTKKGRKTRLFCLDDGEELSEEKGGSSGAIDGSGQCRI